VAPADALAERLRYASDHSAADYQIDAY